MSGNFYLKKYCYIINQCTALAVGGGLRQYLLFCLSLRVHVVSGACPPFEATCLFSLMCAMHRAIVQHAAKLAKPAAASEPMGAPTLSLTLPTGELKVCAPSREFTAVACLSLTR